MYKANHERYQFAEQLYCFTDKTMPEISELAKIPLRTLYQRARDYKWETLRRASRRSPLILCEEMYRELADLTASINSRPEGQRVPTPTEAELRRKILYSIATIKKFPTHAEVLFIMQSLIRYGNHFHYDRVDGLQNLVEGFLAHRDIYGFSSFQPEHNQDLNYPNDIDLENDEQYRDPIDTMADINHGLLKSCHPEPGRRAHEAPGVPKLTLNEDGTPAITTKFKTHPKASGSNTFSS